MLNNGVPGDGLLHGKTALIYGAGGSIGGAVARIGSTVYDGSVKTKLENLRETLIGA